MNNGQTITHRLRVDSRVFSRSTSDGAAIKVQWLGHGTTEAGDSEPRALTDREKCILAVALLDGYRWKPV